MIMTMTSLQKKQIHVLCVTAFIVTVVVFLYPFGDETLKKVRTNVYTYGYSVPKDLVIDDVSLLPAAQAVPILMYHGVIGTGVVGTNTSRETFIAQMELLKRNGYTTISVHEYDLFRHGQFVLPPKPIIVTFDDGRKDSFYTVDGVLKKLGFKATMFVATAPTNNNDSFFLNWDELHQVRATGRWEIEAHGQRSHDDVITDARGTKGAYLVSREYVASKGMESTKDYRKRVEDDYIQGIQDLKKHLGITSHYFAVPMNHYGADETSDYSDAYAYNIDLTRRYFTFAFIEAVSDDMGAQESFYNYADSPMYSLKRLEVKNISAVSLLDTLDRFAPRPPSLVLAASSDIKPFLQKTQLLYGVVGTGKSITLSSATGSHSGRVLFGDWGWKDYSMKVRMVREKGRAVSLLVYYTDEDNYISLNWDDTSLQLMERVNGREREIAPRYEWYEQGMVEALIRIRHNAMSVYFSGITMAYAIPITLVRGAAGLSVWDPTGSAQSTIKKMEIVSLGE